MQPSPKLELAVPSDGDVFSTENLASNWEKIDAAPGIHICTSTTRPVWNANKYGRMIFETNTDLLWRWSSNGWIRVGGGTGVLKVANGNFAIAERTTNFSTSSKSFVRALTMSNVTVPAGRRGLMVVASWRQGSNPNGNFWAAVFRSNVNDSGPRMAQWIMSGEGELRGQGGSFVCFEREGLPAGTYDFSLQIRSLENRGGTSSLEGGVGTPISLAVLEL